MLNVIRVSILLAALVCDVCGAAGPQNEKGASTALQIIQPLPTAIAHVGTRTDPRKFMAVVKFSSDGVAVEGLRVDDFRVFVQGIEATINAVAFIEGLYWLVVQAPPQVANGQYEFAIRRLDRVSGSPRNLASVQSAIAYSAPGTDHLLVLDRSSPMSQNGKMMATQNAANLYVDLVDEDDAIGVVPFATDVTPSPFDLTPIAPGVRNEAENYIDNLNPGALASLGAGLLEAVDQRSVASTGNAPCAITLLSNEVQTASPSWNDVDDFVLGSDCLVTTIALGRDASDRLLQLIAYATGGRFFFSDLLVSKVPTLADMNLRSADNFAFALTNADGRVRLLRERGAVPKEESQFNFPPDQVHQVFVDDSVSRVNFTLDWASINEPDCDNLQNSNGCFGIDLRMELVSPGGERFAQSGSDYAFEDIVSGHLGWRVEDPETGLWRIEVNAVEPYVFSAVEYQVLVTGRSEITAELVLSDRTGRVYVESQLVPIHMIVSSDEPYVGAEVMAQVTDLDGSFSDIPLCDDGLHDDGEANDGLYSGYFAHSTNGGASNLGPYHVRATVVDGALTREALGAFALRFALGAGEVPKGLNTIFLNGFEPIVPGAPCAN